MQRSSRQHSLKIRSNRRGHGVALVYLAVSMTAFIAISSLAVDFGRFQLCKTELQRAADVAARAGAFKLASGYSVALSTAASVADENYIDSQTIGSNSNVTVNIQLLKWTSSTNYSILSSSNYSQANAIQVSLTYNVPLSFANIIGLGSKPATRSSTAMIITSSQTLTVPAKGDPWLAGEPTGTQASQPDPGYEGQGVNPNHPWQYDYAGPVGGSMADGQPYSSPVQSSLTITPGSIITITNVSGAAAHDPIQSTSNAAGVTNGETNGIYDDAKAAGISEHGIADAYMPINSMNAVFLGNNLPDDNTAPPVLDFTTQSQMDYTTLSPEIQQPFFVGLGQTSTGTQQSIVVPKGATRLFLGMMDGWEWDNNVGSYAATITQISVQTVQ
jgi:Flp pilus assembly protein TadG